MIRKLILLFFLITACQFTLAGSTLENRTAEAKAGDPAAQSELGRFYANGLDVKVDYKQAFYWYSTAAAQGYAVAQCGLGSLYRNGHGVQQDYKQAVYWYTKAAEQDDAAAQDFLGYIYAGYWGDNIDIPQDYKQAAYWFKKSAAKGYTDAQLNLGRLYAEGRGVPRNYKKAYVLLSLANHDNDEIADALSKLTPGEVEEAKKELAAARQRAE